MFALDPSKKLQAADKYYEDWNVLENETVNGEDTYNLWRGAITMYEKGATWLAVLIIIWSGIIPFVKVFVISVYLWAVAWFNKPPPPYFGVFFSFGRLALFDVFCVVAACSFLRFHFEDYEWSKKVDDTLEIRIKLSIWLAATAQEGVYYYLASILLSQVLGLVAVYVGRTYGLPEHFDEGPRTPTPLAPLLNRASLPLPPHLSRFAVRLTLFAAVYASIAWPYMVESFKGAFRVRFSFNASGESHDIKYHLDTYRVYDHSMFGVLNTMLDRVHGWGGNNETLLSVGIAFVFVLPLLRLALRVLALAFDELFPDGAALFVRRSADACDLFVAHDVFAGATFITLLQVTELIDDAGNDNSDLTASAQVKAGWGSFVALAVTEDLVSFAIFLLMDRTPKPKRAVNDVDAERQGLLGRL